MDDGIDIDITVSDSIGDVDAAAWNRRVGHSHPFMSHEFLRALEDNDCLAPQGWHPQHLIARAEGELVGAMPLYLKDNSYGEFVFDWNWADAYERAGGQYYPKLVNAVPFSPVCGPRVPARDASVARRLTDFGAGLVDSNRLSSLHQLFLPPSEVERSRQSGLLERVGVQYHWFNDGYADFDDFLARLTSKRRKEIRRERRRVAESGLELMTVAGQDITPRLWERYYEFYCSTFFRKWGEPRLTIDFFVNLAESLGERVILELAFAGDEPVAGAFLVAGDDALFGRHWGCSEAYKHLHFELCYYRPIDYCIARGLRRFDAGAQGEHKLARGFVPCRTHSAHYIADPGFRRAVADFLRREKALVEQQLDVLAGHVAYNEEAAPAALAHALPDDGG